MLFVTQFVIGFMFTTMSALVEKSIELGIAEPGYLSQLMTNVNDFHMELARKLPKEEKQKRLSRRSNPIRQIAEFVDKKLH